MLLDSFNQTLRTESERSYFIDSSNGENITYGNLGRASDMLLELLKPQIKSGEVVGLKVREAKLYMVALIACWKLGAIPAIFNPSILPSQFNSLAEHIQTKLVLTDHDSIEELLNIPSIRLDQITFEPHNQATFKPIFVLPTQVCIMLFTSGTTDFPKCVPLSFENVENNIKHFSDRLDLSQNDVFLCTSPLWYAHGLYNSFLTALTLGGKIVWGGGLSIISAAKVLKSAVNNGATIYHFTPSMIPILALYAGRSGCPVPNLRYAICGTSRLPPTDKANFEEVFHTPVLQQYGTTEALIMSINTSKNEPYPESVGTPIGCSIKIVHDDGNDLGTNITGNIIVKSDATFGCYYKQPVETALAYKSGWFQTGDLGLITNDGHLIISGRKKDIIKKSGININPNQIDTIINEHDKVEKSITVGVPDETYGEDIYTFVKVAIKTSENELKTHCAAYLPKNYIPRRILFVKDFPKTDSGKIKRSELVLLANKV